MEALVVQLSQHRRQGADQDQAAPVASETPKELRCLVTFCGLATFPDARLLLMWRQTVFCESPWCALSGGVWI